MDRKNIFVKETQPALYLCGSKDFKESLVNVNELAPFHLTGDSCFVTFRANRVNVAFPNQGLKSPYRQPTIKSVLIGGILLNDGGVSNLTVPSAKTKDYTVTSGDANHWSGNEFIPLGVGVNLFSDLPPFRFLGSAMSLKYSIWIHMTKNSDN